MDTKVQSTAKMFISVSLAITLGLFAVATPAQAMTCNSATFNGIVTTNGNPTRARFTYGTNSNTVSSGGGIATAVQTFDSDGIAQQFISGLSANTNYYYRLEVTNQYGSDNGGIVSFTTPACENNTTPTPPPAPQQPANISINANPTNIIYNNTGTGTNPSVYNPPVYNYPPTYNYNYPATVNISADNTNVSYGGSTTIRWYTSNASYCYGTGGNNGWATSRSTYSDSFYTGAIYSTTTYGIVCSGSNGQSANANASVTIYVNQPQYVPPPVYVPPPTYQAPADLTATIFSDSQGTGTVAVRPRTTTPVIATATENPGLAANALFAGILFPQTILGWLLLILLILILIALIRYATRKPVPPKQILLP